MILSNVNIGTSPSAGDGDPLRSAFDTINTNFQIVTNNVNSLSNSVTSVAGRDGNVILTVNDIVGLPQVYVNIAVASSWISSNIAALVDNAPEALDTLNEIAAAINDDANIAGTLLSAITAANVGQTGYTDNEVLTANIGMLGYVDLANITMKNYVDQVATLTSYGNANVKSYLISGFDGDINPSANLTYNLGSISTEWNNVYASNVRINNQVIFNDASEQFTAWTGSEHRSYFSSNLRYKPSWLSYYPGGDKNTYAVNFGFDATDGMYFAGNADYPAYPIRLNTGFQEDDKIEVVTTIDFDNQGDDNSIAIFLANAEPQYSFTSNVTRIAWYSNFGTATLSGQTGANVSPLPVIFAGNIYTIKFEYDRTISPSVTVSTYLGTEASGVPVVVNALDEQLPHGLFTVGFDGDNDTPGNNSKFSNLTVKTLNNSIHAVNVAIQGYINDAISTANIGQIGYTDNAVTTANTGVVGYIDNAVTTANVGIIGYIDSQAHYSNVNTLAYLTTNSYATEAYVTAANVGQIGYTDDAVSTANVGLIGYIGNEVTTANTGVVGYIDDQLTSYAVNVAIQGWTTEQITQANVGVIGYVDNAVTTANVGIIGYIDSQAHYSNVNLASYQGNIQATVNGYEIGYRNIPQIAAANVTLAISDAGKHYYATSTAPTTLTIPSNANVAFPIGTAISIVNKGTGNITLALEAEASVYLAGNATSSTRTITTYGMATLMKTATDEWFVNGTGVV